MKKRKQYSEECKKDAVRLMHARGARSIADVVRELGISSSMLHRWERKYGTEIRGGAVESQEDREKVERLRRRLRELEMENALVKKAAALFAKDVK